MPSKATHPTIPKTQALLTDFTYSWVTHRPLKLTCPTKITVPKMESGLQTIIFQGHVGFRGCRISTFSAFFKHYLIFGWFFLVAIAGGVGFICALDPSDGSVLWYTEMNGMTKALTLMKLQKKWWTLDLKLSVLNSFNSKLGWCGYLRMWFIDVWCMGNLHWMAKQNKSCLDFFISKIDGAEDETWGVVLGVLHNRICREAMVACKNTSMITMHIY